MNRSFSLLEMSPDPMVEMLRGMFSQAVAIGASDIHIVASEKHFYAEYRCNGVLSPQQEYDNNIQERLDASLLDLVSISSEDVSRNHAVSGRLFLSRGGRKRCIEVRYERHKAAHPTGFHVSLRLLFPGPTSDRQRGNSSIRA